MHTLGKRATRKGSRVRIPPPPPDLETKEVPMSAVYFLYMNQFMLRNVLGWGFALWLIGYLLGFVFYAFVPPEQIGWYVMPLGIVLTLYVLTKWVPLATLRNALVLGLGWSIIAVVCDYVGIVMLLNPADGYYKLDVYLYYLLTLLLPLAIYLFRRR